MNTFFTQLFSNAGEPGNGYKIYSYVQGTTTPRPLYQDSSFQTPHTNPLILDSAGRADVFLSTTGGYKLVYTDNNDVILDTLDNVIAGSGTGVDIPDPEIGALYYNGSTLVWDNTFLREGDYVSSFNGRRGDVVPQAGDYTPELTGSEPELPHPTTTGKCLTSDELGFKSWVDIPSTLPPNGNAGGDLVNQYPNPSVSGLLGKPLPALDGNAFLKYTNSNWTWDQSTYQTKASNLDALSAAVGDGVFKRVNNVWTMDNNTYITQNQNITLQNDVTGSGTNTILTTVTGIRGVSVPALTSGKLTYTTGANTFSWMPTVSSAGVTGSVPNFNRSTDAIIVNAFEVNIYTNSAFLGEPVKLHVPQSVINNIPRDGNTKFIVVNYNGGFPFSYLESVARNINMSDRVAIAYLWNIDGDIHLTDFGLSGDGLINKLQNQHLNTLQYQRSLGGGLILGNDAALHVTVTPATVYYGGVEVVVPAYGSANINNKLTMVYHSAGVWTYSTVVTGGQYDNTNYDNGTNLVAMSSGKCSVRWMYRSIGDDTQVFYTLGSAEYSNTAQAQAELEPDPSVIPQILRDHCLLIGKIIIAKGANTGTAYSSLTPVNNVSPITDHTQLSNLNSTSYYHLTQTQYTDLTDGGDSTLHYHATDRNRSNHNGTQTASTISDFTTTVQSILIDGGVWT